MKRGKKKEVFIGLLIVLFVSISVGYAYLGTDLKINSSVHLKKDYNLVNNILKNNGGVKFIESKGMPDLSKSAVSQKYYDSLPDTCDGKTEWCESKDRAIVENGMYSKDDDYGTSYFFRGGDVNNNIMFAGYCWKIIRINGDRSIRIIYNGKSCSASGKDTIIGESKFNEGHDDNADMDYMYGQRGVTADMGSSDEERYNLTHANKNDSTIKKFIDEWYKNNLVNYSDYLSDTLFCNDREISPFYEKSSTYPQLGYGKVHTVYSSYMRRFNNTNKLLATLNCVQQNDRFTVKNGDLIYSVGLITMDEVILSGAGTKFDGWGSLYFFSNRNFYLYNGVDYWTMTPYDLSSDTYANEFYVNSTGTIIGHATTFLYGVRPVINLKSNTIISGGNGEVNSPYIVG